MPASAPDVVLEDLSVVFDSDTGEVAAVDGVSLRVEAGEAFALIGTSGSGKTTTLKTINRLVEPTSGRVQVGGLDVRQQELTTLRRGIGYVIQRGGLFPHMTVSRNVGLLCELEGWSAARVGARVTELLELVGMPPGEFAGRYPGELSGGQRQRIGVARSLALDPGLVLLDEPFGALDPITRDQLHREFHRLRERVGKTMILVTHDMAEAFELADRVALMDRGKIVQQGTEADFRERPANEFVEEFLRSHLGSTPGGRA